MKYLVKGNIVLSTENWEERMVETTIEYDANGKEKVTKKIPSIENYAKENGFKIVDNKPNELIIKELKVSNENELLSIRKWFSDNDYKVNKIMLGEWTSDDARWLEYIKERKIKRARQDELLKGV